MADDSVNGRVTDAVTITTTATVGEAVAVALGMFYQAEAQAFALGMQNAVASQQHVFMIGEAVTATACAKIMKLAV